jgi:hypothetical protein
MKKVSFISAFALVGAAVPVLAASFIPVSLPDRARGAASVVIASVESVSATWETNEYGDRLIVSHVALQIGETLKGRPAQRVSMDLEGGTLDGLTLEVSSLPKLSPGERAVFFLTPGPNGHNQPYLRGQGILKLDATDHVPHSSLDLDTIRQAVANAAGR